MKQKSGSIVLTGSPHAWGGEYDRAAYAVSKGALYTLSEHIAKNYSKYNIRCNYLTMGWTDTEGERALRCDQGYDFDEFCNSASKQIPLGRLNTPEDYVAMLVLLMSDYSLVMNGSICRMTGGFYI